MYARALSLTESARLDAVADPRPVHVASDEARLFQNLQVLGDRGLGQRQLVHDVAANAGVAVAENPQDLHAGRMPQRAGERSELLVCVASLHGAQIGLGVLLVFLNPTPHRTRTSTTIRRCLMM